MFQLVAIGFAIAGAVAATGPIIIHLLNRRRYRTLDWAAMDFLREALQRSRRILQWRDMLLLALRVLCILLFGLALAQPYFARAEAGAAVRYGLVAAAVLAGLGLAIWAVVSHRRWTKALVGVLALAALGYAAWGVYDIRRYEAALAGEAGGGRQPVHAVLMIDNSLSMGYTTLNRTLLDDAKAKAAAFIDELPPGSRISILPVCGPRSEFSLEPFRTREDARDELNAIRVVDRRAGLSAAVGLALEALKKAPDVPLKRVAFIGDQQLGDWPKGVLDAAKDLPELQVVQVTADDLDNAWVEEMKVRDGLADVELPATIIATVRYEGPQRRGGVQVSLEVDGVQVATRSVDLEPKQALDVTFTHKFDVSVEPGVPSFSRVKVSLPQDRLPQDDQRHLIVPVVAALPVVFVDQYGQQGEDPKRGWLGETLHLRRLLAPVLSREERGKQLVRVRHTTMDRLCRSLPLNDQTPADEPGRPVPLEDARLVVIAGVERPDEQAVQLLREYVLQGGQVVIAAGSQFDAEAWNRTAWLDGAGILPVPLTGQTIGSLPGDATAELKPFGLSFQSLKDDRLFHIEGEAAQRLEDLYRDPALLFFKAVAADASDETLETIVVAEAKRLAAEREFLKEESQRAQREARGLLKEDELARRDEDRRRLAELRPQWLLWRGDDESAAGSAGAEPTRPHVHARYTSDLPFLVSRRIGQGRVAFVTSGVFFGAEGSGWNTMTKTDALVVYSRLLRSLIENTLPPRNLATDKDELALPVAAAYRRSRIALTRPDGKEEALAVEALGSERYGVTVRNAVERGTYQVTARRGDEGQGPAAPETKLWDVPLALNGPAEESDLAPLSRVEFEKRLAETDAAVAARIRWIGGSEPIQLEGAARSGQDMWWRAFVVTVLACLIAELFILAWPALRRVGTTGGRTSNVQHPTSNIQRRDGPALDGHRPRHLLGTFVTGALYLALLTVVGVVLSWATGLDQWLSIDWLNHVRLSAEWAGTKAGQIWLLGGCAGIVVLTWLFYARAQVRGSARMRGMLALSRAAVLCLLVLVLAEPLLVRRFTQQKRPQLWLLVDGTDSMAIRDEWNDDERARLVQAVGSADALTQAVGAAVEDGTSNVKRPTPNAGPVHYPRSAYVQALLAKADQNLLAALSEKFRLKLFVFDESVRELPDFDQWVGNTARAAQDLTTSGQYTALGTAVTDLARRQATNSLAGLVVISDFAQNAGSSADVAAARLGVPVYAVGVGRPAAKDLRVRLDTPMWMTKNERDEVLVTVEQEGVEEKGVNVKLTARRVDNTADPATAEAKVIGQKTVDLPGSVVTVPFPYTPEETGQFIFSAEVDPLPGEIVEANNQAEREVAVRDDFLRLMYVEYEPTWEWRFIKEVFHRDKLVGMRGFRTFLRSSDPKVRQQNELFLPTLTPKRSDFFANDVIFLGDMPSSALSPRFCELTKEFVGRFGGGLVVISGPRFGPGQLAGTPLADMLPVVVDPDLRPRDQREFTPRFAAEASGYPFMRLGAGAEENDKAWKNLERLPWYQPVARASDRATVLAVHPEDRCANGQPQPLIAVRQYGDGLVVYLAFNETWRLRRMYGEKYYRQFWGQMIHQLASRRALGTQKRFVARTDRPEYRVDEQVVLSVEAYDAEYNPLPDDKLEGGKLSAELLLPERTATGESRLLPVQLTRRREAQFETKLSADAPGEYRVRIKDPVTGRYAETKFVVRDVSAERRVAVRNVALQKAIGAAVPGGKIYELDEAARLVNDIQLPEQMETQIEVRPLWSTWLCFALVVMLLLGEWLMRKIVTLP
jgi:hypothetical protein